MHMVISFKAPCVLWLLFVVPLYANMRAPMLIERGVSQLKGKPANITVKGADLLFQCPAAHTGKTDMEKFANRHCLGRVGYAVEVPQKQKLAMAFVYSGASELTWLLYSNQRNAPESFVAGSRAFSDAEKRHCTFCPDEMRRQRVSEIPLDLSPDVQKIGIEYQQALDFSESGHGYFRDGSWTQGFTYELWPLAEWQWQQELVVELTLIIAARPGFLGIGYKSDRVACTVREGAKMTPVVLSGGEKVDAVFLNKREGAGNEHTAARHFTARLQLAKAPQRLACFWSAG